MFIVKNKYFLIVESIKDFNLKNIKIRNKFTIIYRNKKKNEELKNLIKFRQNCKSRAVKFYVANDIKLAILLNSDGIYLSSFTKDLKFLNYRKSNFKIIGSAHNFKEISLKKKQGCSFILLSKLFLVNYDENAPYMGIVKFNNLSNFSNQLIPLGGIKSNNLNQLKNVSSEGFAILSELKKKPAKIISRLF